MLNHNSIVLLLCIIIDVLILPFGFLLSGKKTMLYCITLAFLVMAFGVIYSVYVQTYKPFFID